jgi:hypothetical protein
MTANLSWLIGEQLVETVKTDYTWLFRFTGGGSITTESGWRLVTNGGIGVASDDHGQIFGLKEPVDAGVRVLAATKGKKVQAFCIAERTSDLTLRFKGEVCLEFLNLSCGYESWRTQHEAEEVICMGGGQVVIHSNERKA